MGCQQNSSLGVKNNLRHRSAGSRHCSRRMNGVEWGPHNQPTQHLLQFQQQSRNTSTLFVNSLVPLAVMIRGRRYNRKPISKYFITCWRSYSAAQPPQHQSRGCSATVDCSCAHIVPEWETGCCQILSSWSAISMSELLSCLCSVIHWQCELQNWLSALFITLYVIWWVGLFSCNASTWLLAEYK